MFYVPIVVIANVISYLGACLHIEAVPADYRVPSVTLEIRNRLEPWTEVWCGGLTPGRTR